MSEAIRDVMIELAAMSDARREYYATPWSRGEWSYATDGRMMIRALRFSAFAERPQNDMCIEAFDRLTKGQPGPALVDIPVLPDDPGPCQQCHGGKSKECDACHGSGEVEWRFSHAERSHNMQGTCPVCAGSGMGPCSACDGAGRAKEAPVEVGPALIKPAYLRLMARLPGCQIAPVGGRNPSPFRFGGGSGVVMPMWRE